VSNETKSGSLKNSVNVNANPLIILIQKWFWLSRLALRKALLPAQSKFVLAGLVDLPYFNVDVMGKCLYELQQQS